MSKLFITNLVLLNFSLLFSLFAKDDFPFLQVVEDSVSNPSNKVQILNSGMSALEKRLQMIELAKKSISIETFIFDPSHRSVRLILQALLEKAKSGIHIRILVDAGPGTWKLRSKHVDALNELCKESASCKPIELRMYNRIPAPSLFFISSLNFRNHRKMFLVDDDQGLTGGRNLADEYFDLDLEYNFMDRDVYVNGPVAKTMRLSFDRFWYGPMSIGMEKLRYARIVDATEDEIGENRYGDGPGYEDLQNIKKDYWGKTVKNLAVSFATNKSDKELLKRVRLLGKKLLNDQPVGGCQKLTFVSDKSGWKRSDFVIGKAEYTRKDLEEARLVEKNILMYAAKAKKSVVASSPYMIATGQSKETVEQIISNGVELTLMTNSLYSTDGVQVAAMFYDKLPYWLGNGIKVFIHPGKFFPYSEVFPEVKNTRWGTHAKTYLYDDDSFMIGSFNMDNRSSFYNTEAAIFCEGNIELVAKLEEDMSLRRSHFLQIKDSHSAIDSDGNEVGIYGTDNFLKILELKLWTPISKIVTPLL